VCNYEGLKSIFCDFKPIGTESKRRTWRLNQSKLDEFNSFDCFVIDEVHRVNDYKSIQSKICFELSKRVRHVIGITGTPVDKSMLELFNIMKVIDLGRSLGGDFFLYRNKYFYQHGYDWELKTGAKEEILNRISDVVIYFDRKECFDLPKNDEIIWIVDPNDEFNRIQTSIVKKGIVEVQDGNVKIKLDSIKAKGEILRQISAGFFYYDMNNQRYTYRLKNNPKVEALIDKIKDINGKIIVFFRYIEEGNIILEALNKSNISYVVVRGGEKSNDENIKKFQEDKKCKIMVAQTSVAGECWDGSIAQVAIFFSPVSSPRIREQCIGRIFRSGQKEETLAYYFAMVGSIDFKILSNKEKRQSFVSSVIEFLKENGGKI
jgi:SNF2 family DNA or RNA helicase